MDLKTPAADRTAFETELADSGVTRHELGWYRCRFPDKGAGATGWLGYVEAEDAETARKVARECSNLSVFDTTKGTVARVGETIADIEKGLLRAGPNEAIRRDGVVVRQSEAFPETFER
jgi:hypothetical protein